MQEKQNQLKEIVMNLTIRAQYGCRWERYDEYYRNLV